MAHKQAPSWLLWLTLVSTLVGCGPREAGKLPPVALKGAFEKHNVPREMAVGEKTTAEVSFKNSSTMTWPSKANAKGKYAVNFSYHWLNSKKEVVVFDGLRTALPNDVKAGESVQLRANIQAPDQPGSYLLELTLVQEANAWFPEVDSENKVTVPVNVGAAKSVASAAPAPLAAAPAPSKLVEAKASEKLPEEAKEKAKEKETEKKSRKQKRREVREKTKSEPAASAEVKKGGSWAVQVGTYPDEKDANLTAARLKEKGFDAFVVRGDVKGKRWYRVRVGRLASRAEAETLQKKLAGQEKTGQSMIVANR
ncbi:MAG: hypothetical protein FJ145_05205 [Deltaproteobacteria bacterium]|nr:hypothetical protein [Deltaproteobacteria bacterium]